MKFKKKNEEAKIRQDFMWAVRSLEGRLDTDEMYAYAINAIGRELSASTAAGFVLKGCTENDHYGFSWATKVSEGLVPISAKRVNVIAVPREMDLLKKAVLSVAKHGIVPEMRMPADPIRGDYFKELNLLFVNDGRHHASAAITGGEDFDISASVYEIGDMFNSVETNGFEWKCAGESPYPVPDIRLALIFHLAKQRYLRQKKNSDSNRLSAGQLA